MTITYRNMQPDDLPAFMEMTREMAVFEKLESMLTATKQDLHDLFFRTNPHAFCLVAEMESKLVGFCAYFYSLSTFVGRPGLYIHDIYVREAQRGHGIGKAFFKELAKKAMAENCSRIEWDVLDWNAPAIAFYDKLGATPLTEWVTYRMEEDTIAKLAEKDVT